MCFFDENVALVTKSIEQNKNYMHKKVKMALVLLGAILLGVAVKGYRDANTPATTTGS